MRALQEALEEVYGSDQSLEAGAVADKLADRCYAIVPVGFTYDLAELAVARRLERRYTPARMMMLLVSCAVLAMALLLMMAH